MKHVGLNVAADPFMNSAMTGAHGGLLITVADDPSMHSSQNEQDSRFYGRFAMIPVLEPSNQQECYDMAFYGFELSEKYHIPVMIRTHHPPFPLPKRSCSQKHFAAKTLQQTGRYLPVHASACCCQKEVQEPDQSARKVCGRIHPKPLQRVLSRCQGL